MNWFDAFAFAATAAMQIAFASVLIWLVASNWMVDRKLVLVSAGLATVLVASSLPFNDERLPTLYGIALCGLVGTALLLAWLRKSRLTPGDG